jgi:hypothetical protein
MSERVRFFLQWASRYSFHCVLFVAATAASIWIALNVGVLGEIPQGYFSRGVHLETELDYAAGLLWWSLLAVVLWLLGGADRQHLLIAWTIKFFVVLVAMLFYEYKYRYNLDTFGYFNTVLTGYFEFYPGVDWFRESWIPSLVEVVGTGPGEGRLLTQSAGTENMLKILLIIAQVTGPYFHALKVLYAFLGFIGTWFVYRAVVVIVGRPFLPAFYGLVLYPSILFWSAILGKDPLFLLFIGLYAYGGALWLVQASPRGLAWVVLGLLGSFLFRPWTAAIEAAPLLLATLVKFFGLRPVVFVCVVVAPGILYGTDLSASFQLMETSALLEELAVKAGGAASEEGSGTGFDFVEAQDMLSSPQGILIIIFSGLFRPLPFDVTNLMVAMAAVENSILLVLTLVAFRYLRWARLEQPVFLWALTYSLTWSGAYGLIVLSNFGSGMRYKLQVLPFIVLFLFLLLTREGRAALDRIGFQGRAPGSGVDGSQDA